MPGLSEFRRPYDGMAMAEPYDYTQEDHAREVERALMYVAQAQRKCDEIAATLADQGAEERLVDGLRTTAGALRAEHNRLLNRSHFPVPDHAPLAETEHGSDAGEGSLLDPDDDAADTAADDQQRMAI